MKPAEGRHALRGRSFLACPYLWSTALLHAALIATLLFMIHWTPKGWTSSWDYPPLLGFVNVFAVQVGTVAWLVDVAACLLIQTRWGLEKSLAYGLAMAVIWTTLIVASLDWVATRFDESIPMPTRSYY